MQPSIEPVITKSSVPSDFLVLSQVSWLGTVTPSHPKLHQHMVSSFSCEEEDIVIHNGWTPEEKIEKSCVLEMMGMC